MSELILPKEGLPEDSGSSLLDYCDVCLRILECIPKCGENLWTRYDLPKSTPYRDSAEHCPLCQFVVTHLEDFRGHHTDIVKVEEGASTTAYMVRICCYRSFRLRDGQRSVTCFCKLFLLGTKESGIGELGELDFAVWAEEGSRASSSLVTRRPILKYDAESINNTIEDWYAECTSHHNGCGLIAAAGSARTDDDVKLPSRILEISGNTEVLTVRLIATQESKGTYCALSHCWGSEDCQPIKTTTENIHEHMLSINYAALPRTFKDAVLTTHRLGIRHLWIDSLCIIQDDIEDWKQESQTMGLLYKEATVVLAAAGSTNPSGGLFMSGRSQSHTVTVPFIKDGAAQGVFNIARTPYCARKCSMHWSPLESRGWALQELYFARRLVLFLAESIGWHCQSRDWQETGAYGSHGVWQNRQWSGILSNYSTRHLTYPSDRLIAIQGIVNEEQPTRSGRFINGIWEDNMAAELLWHGTRWRDADWDDPPSWSWASKGGPKYWPIEIYSGWTEGLTQALRIEPPDTIRVTGRLIQLDFDKTAILECCTIRITGGTLLSTFLLGNPTFAVRKESSSRGSLCGLAKFDEQDSSPAQCLLLLRNGSNIFY
ncbi:heterokaryon incompatibility protein-domain-containing protein [Lophiotrema nucula]|uniref:Heterokaryon incompatibility protein-domain-containing protein n=1 Tax=Lophiotrema nucula TaxID=690887 RepID=A0A6A5ZT55_9PLEO|nr:heterokaryon incompatibility protein-domain-containing protein [Lophiotrema nucula]